MKIERFEDIKAWQLAKEVVMEVYDICRNTRLAKDFGLRDQIQRSSVSTMSNISEGFERESKKEFIKYLVIARASAAETESLLYVISELSYIEECQFKLLYGKLTEIAKMTNGLIKYLRSYKPKEQK
jgi:four helix bundle protein